MSDVSQQILHNQVCGKLLHLKRKAFFTTLQTTTMASAELRNQSMELEGEKIQLKRLKVRKELRLMKDSNINNEVEIADDHSGGDNDLNKCNWQRCVQQPASELCNVCNMQSMHHVCQTEAEQDAGLDDGHSMKRIRYTCHHGFKKTLHVHAV